ncbi:transposase [Agathobaculum hominis]|uniref:Transposase n=1 Tax=Agathobaculum hominis TaxID=2763014 RepID=A0ABR7GN07_9FIRM|nr:transposase [Agathobaculum hominis]
MIPLLENVLENSLRFYAFPKPDARKILSFNMIDRLNCEIQRRISVIRIFPNENSYVRLLTTYLMVLEYAEKRSISRV